jgi:hypothetical protein
MWRGMMRRYLVNFIFLFTAMVSAKAPETGLSFDRYLDQYYPNAKVMTGFFTQMKPTEVDKALGHLAEMLKGEPYHYFMNHKRNFDGRYLDVMLRELDSLLLFLERAKVDQKKETIFSRDSHDVVAMSDGTIIPLLDYFQEQSLSAYYELYALSFDFLVIKFNSSILSQYCDRSQWKSADGALRKMKREVGHLKDGKLGEAYQEYCQRYESIWREWEKALKDKEAAAHSGKKGGRHAK